MDEFLTEDEKRKALAEAMGLRQQMQLGQIAQVAGGRSMPRLGKSMQEGATDLLRLAESGRNRELQTRLQAKRDDAEQAYRGQDLELRRLSLTRDKFRPEVITDPATGKEVVGAFDPATGNIKPTGYAPGTKNSPTAEVRRQSLISRASQGMLKDLDPSQYGGAIKNQVAARDQAEHILALAQRADGSIVNLDSREQHELALGLAKLIKGGQATQSEGEALIPPKTRQAGVEAIKEWLLNEPRGLNQQKFVERMVHSVERQKAVAEDLINKAKAQRVGAHRKLRELDPEQWEANVISAGLSADNFDEKGVYRIPEPKKDETAELKERISARVRELAASGITDKKSIRQMLVRDGLVKDEAK